MLTVEYHVVVLVTEISFRLFSYTELQGLLTSRLPSNLERASKKLPMQEGYNLGRLLLVVLQGFSFYDAA
jgi:hypothetical protein